MSIDDQHLRLRLFYRGMNPVIGVLLSKMPVLMRHPRDDLRMFAYRPGFFSQRFARLAAPAVGLQRRFGRRPAWTIGDNYLFFGYVSHLNACPHCISWCGAVASLTMGESTVEAVFTDLRMAPVSQPTRKVLELLAKLARTPHDVEAADIDTIRVLGVSDDEIEQVIALTAVTHVYNRLVDAFGAWGLDMIVDPDDRSAAARRDLQLARVARWADRLLRLRPVRYQDRFERLRDRVGNGPGHLDRSVRRAALDGAGLPSDVQPYVEKVIENAYKVTDQDVAQLLGQGYTEGQVYELTVAAALGTGLVRWEQGRRAMLAKSSSKQ